MVGQVGEGAAEVGGEGAGVVLDVAEVVEVELGAGHAAVGEAAVGGEGMAPGNVGSTGTSG